jgi:hypothetical protein
LTPPEEPAGYFMILPLGATGPASVVSFHPVFYGASQKSEAPPR